MDSSKDMRDQNFGPAKTPKTQANPTANHTANPTKKKEPLVYNTASAAKSTSRTIQSIGGL